MNVSPFRTWQEMQFAKIMFHKQPLVIICKANVEKVFDFDGTRICYVSITHPLLTQLATFAREQELPFNAEELKIKIKCKPTSAGVEVDADPGTYLFNLKFTWWKKDMAQGLSCAAHHMERL